MAWDFSTEPEFQEKLVWIKQFCEEKVGPLHYVFPHAVRLPDPKVRELVRQYLAEPCTALLRVATAKSVPSVPRFHHGLLHGVGRRKLALESAIDFQTRQQRQPRLMLDQPAGSFVIISWWIAR